jgi:L-methionine (R)-S-oxide reductase
MKVLAGSLHGSEESSVGNEISILIALQTILARSGSRESRAQNAAEAVRISGPYRWIGIYDVDAQQGTVSILAWSGPAPPAHPVFALTQGLTARAIASKRTVNVGRVALDPQYLAALDGTQSEIIVPVLDRPGGNVVGTLDVESQQRDAFDTQVEKLLEACAEVLRPLWVRS